MLQPEVSPSSVDAVLHEAPADSAPEAAAPVALEVPRAAGEASPGAAASSARSQPLGFLQCSNCDLEEEAAISELLLAALAEAVAEKRKAEMFPRPVDVLAKKLRKDLCAFLDASSTEGKLATEAQPAGGGPHVDAANLAASVKGTLTRSHSANPGRPRGLQNGSLAAKGDVISVDTPGGQENRNVPRSNTDVTVGLGRAAWGGGLKENSEGGGGAGDELVSPSLSSPSSLFFQETLNGENVEEAVRRTLASGQSKTATAVLAKHPSDPDLAQHPSALDILERHVSVAAASPSEGASGSGRTDSPASAPGGREGNDGEGISVSLWGCIADPRHEQDAEAELSEPWGWKHPPLQVAPLVRNLLETFLLKQRSLLSRISSAFGASNQIAVKEVAKQLQQSHLWEEALRRDLSRVLIHRLDVGRRGHCGREFVSEKEFMQHVPVCPFRRVRCENPGCNVALSHLFLAPHDLACLHKILPCRLGCDQGVPRGMMATHCEGMCPLRMVQCPFAALSGCPCLPVYQKDVETHCQEKMLTHQQLLLDAVLANQAQVANAAKRMDLIEKAQALQEQSVALELRAVKVQLAETGQKLEKADKGLLKGLADAKAQGQALKKEAATLRQQVQGLLAKKT